MTNLKVSYLDVTHYLKASDRAKAIRRSLSLAEVAEAMNLERYWVVEHHSHPEIACSSPPVLLGALTSVTKRIRLGSGGVMLTNHLPHVVAGQFEILSALAPGRIDLGVGRGKGASGLALEALVEASGDFEERLLSLHQLINAQSPNGQSNFEKRGVPIFVLGTSLESAAWAGRNGYGFAFAQHLSADNAKTISENYRRSFCSSMGSKPYLIVAVQVCIGENEVSAKEIAHRLTIFRLRRMIATQEKIDISEEAIFYEKFNETEQFAASKLIDQGKTIVSSRDRLLGSLEDFCKFSEIDEIMLSSLNAELSAQTELIYSVGDR